MVGRKLAHYRILERAGSGSMGEVYRAEDERLKRTVALKRLPANMAGDPARLERFQREAELLAQLDHPNIVTVFSIDRADDVPFLTMAWVEGRTLRQALPESGLELEELLRLGLGLTAAVAAAHGKGITHRDLKPANVMVTDDGVVKVLDFGLAESSGQADDVAGDAETVTRETGLVGTVPYMAPEQVRGLGADPRSDVFALGAMLHEMATGERAFQGASTSDLISAILRDAPLPVDQLRPDLPRHLGRIISRCLRKDPERRYESAKGLRNALDDLRTEICAGQSADKPTIAVLPFVDMSAERDQGYFCEGIAEEILNALASLESLGVAARSSSFHFRQESLDVREIGSRLNVQAILDGGVRKAGNRVRITAQLVNVADGYHLWSECFDRELVDIFAIQEEIASCVVEALELTLSPREKRAIKKPVADIAAYDYYLRGRRFLDRPNEESFHSALEAFGRAIAIDPGYAPAWAGIAESHCWLFAWHGSCDDNLDEADRASAKAVELAPESAQAHAARGYVLSLREDCDAACEEFRRAIELNPRLFEAYYYWGRDRVAAGDFEPAVELLEQAAAVRPDDYQAPLLAAQFYGRLGRPDEARQAAERGLARAQRSLELDPGDVRALYLSAARLWELERYESANARAESALALAPDDPVVLYNVGCFFAVSGVVERALECLERALRLNFGLKGWIEQDNELDSIRSHPRFKVLTERLD